MQTPAADISPRTRFLVVGAALLALFLGALDALVVGAAMPTIVADLGGMHLYSWVFSSYLLTRAISLPIFGKLCDLFSSKQLYIVVICVFLASSALAGAATTMTQLIAYRALQGVGAGGSFALAYIVVSDLSAPEKRGKMMGLISFVWGIASVLGPALGGFIVNYFSWRWIFYLNVPLSFVALLCILLYLQDIREKKKEASIDFLGALTLSVTILTLLTAFLLAGRTYPWLSPQIIGLFLTTIGTGIGFCFAEKRAREPILAPGFFRVRGFSTGNGAAFSSSFAIFAASAFVPLFIQGALGKSPAQLGMAMVPLSLAWSAGALVCGQLVNRLGEKPLSILGSLLLVAGTGVTLTFTTSTSLFLCSAALAATGLGMGFVSVGTLLIVQNSLDASDLGVATSAHQFARTLGGTIGIGVSGSLVTSHLSTVLETLTHSTQGDELPASLLSHLTGDIQELFQPEIQAKLSAGAQKLMQEAVRQGVETVFWATLAGSLVCLLLCWWLPEAGKKGSPKV
jgi:EmrB/QacA subfamily drug resistance transporter